MSGLVSEWGEVAGWRDMLRPWLDKQVAAAVDAAMVALLEGKAGEAYKAAVRWQLTQDFIRLVEGRMHDECATIKNDGATRKPSTQHR